MSLVVVDDIRLLKWQLPENKLNTWSCINKYVDKKHLKDCVANALYFADILPKHVANKLSIYSNFSEKGILHKDIVKFVNQYMETPTYKYDMIYFYVPSSNAVCNRILTNNLTKEKDCTLLEIETEKFSHLVCICKGINNYYIIDPQVEVLVFDLDSFFKKHNINKVGFFHKIKKDIHHNETEKKNKVEIEKKKKTKNKKNIKRDYRFKIAEITKTKINKYMEELKKKRMNAITRKRHNMKKLSIPKNNLVRSDTIESDKMKMSG